ncbi:MAG: orc1/cdc6 family replication initiation protein [Candidatus Aenigmarchaeota archaeon]|nr:orc1/cdc6 family replication initiation protein [Candidatus Aenigmarchaeota archaeon]
MTGLVSFELPSETMADKTVDNKIQEIFSNYLSKQSLFKNREVLSTNFLPNIIIHRDSEIQTVSSIIAPILKGYKPSNLFIYGGIGCGKTVTIKYILEQLSKISNGNYKTVYINCKMKKVSDTEYRILSQLLKEFGLLVPETGISTNILYKKFFECVDGQNIIIIFDEIDALVNKIGDEFLYNISRSEQNISIIGITNNISFADRLDPRVKSSLVEEEIIFKPYNAQQLKDIITLRTAEAFDEDCLDESVINKCAALAAQEHGDARRALELIRVAGEITERLGETRIKEEHLDVANDRINTDKIVETIKSQPRHSQMVLESIMSLKKASKGWQDTRILTGEIYRQYNNLCEKNTIKSLTQRRVCDLINEYENIGIINTRTASRGRHGKIREVVLNIEDDMLKKIDNILTKVAY